MPVFEIGLDDGRKLHIDADDQQAALAGVNHFLGQSDTPQEGTPDTSLPGAVAHGLNEMVGGSRNTLNTLGAPVDAAAPSTDNYQPAQVFKDGKLNAGDIPRAVAEQAVPAATTIGAAKLAARLAGKLPGFWPKVAGAAAGAGVYALQSFGNNAKEAAAARTGDPNAAPETADLKRAAGVTAAQTALAEAPISRFLPGVGAVTRGGMRGVVDAGKRFATTTATGAAAGAGQDLIGQAGLDPSKPIDTDRAISSAITGGATTGTLGLNGLRSDVMGAAKYRAITPELEPAASRFADIVQNEAGGRSLNNVKTGRDAVARATTRVNDALTGAVKSVGDLPPEAQSVISAVKDGQHITPQDYETVANAVSDHPQAQNLIDRLQDAHMATLVKKTGSFSDSKFVGGTMPGLLRATGLTGHGTIKSIIAAGAAEHFGSEIFHQSPEALAAMGGLVGAAFLHDYATGNRSPAARFVNRYGGRGTDVAPTAPTLPNDDKRVTQGPWGPVAPGPSVPSVNSPVVDPMAKVLPKFQQRLDTAVGQVNRQARQQTVAEMMQLVTQRNAIAKAKARAAAAMQAQAMGPLQQLAALSQPKPPQPAEPAINPNALPRDITVPAKNIMAGARNVAGMASDYTLAGQKAEALRQKTAGVAQAEREARMSPLVASVGGFNEVSNPDMVKRAKELVGGAKVLQALRAEPAEEGAAEDGGTSPAAAPIAVAKVRAKIKKVNGEVKVTAPAAQPIQVPPQVEQQHTNGAAHDEAPFDERTLKHTKVNDRDRAVATEAVGSFANSRDNIPSVVLQRYRAATELRQARERDRMQEAVADPDFPSDDVSFGEELAKITSLRSREQIAQHIGDMASQFPQHNAVLRKYFGPKWAKSLWNKQTSSKK